MSLSVIIQQQDKIFISTDSATSYKLNGNLYRIGINAKKLFAINNKLIWIGGNMLAVSIIIKEFEASSDQSIENLKTIIVKTVESNPQIENHDYVLHCIVGVMENNKAIMYSIDSNKDFKIERRTVDAEGGIGVYAAGIRNEEAVNLAIKYIQSETMSIQDVYRNVYNNVAFEGIGGYATLVYLDKNGVHALFQEEIKEKSKDNYKTIKDLNTDVLNNIRQNANLIIAKNLIGDVIAGTKLNITNESGSVNIDGNTITVKNEGKEAITNTTIDGNSIHVANLNADDLVAGTIDASKIHVIHLSASSIDTGTLDASIVDVINLKAQNIDTQDLYIKGQNITDLINNCKIGIGSTYIDSTGAYRNVGGTNYQFKSMVAVGTGSIRTTDGQITVPLPTTFVGKSFSVIVSARTAVSTSGFTLWSDPQTWVNGTFKIVGGAGDGSDEAIEFSYVAVA